MEESPIRFLEREGGREEGREGGEGRGRGGEGRGGRE